MKASYSLAAMVVWFGFSSAVVSQVTEKPKQVIAYEECVSRAFKRSKSVSDVISECEAEKEAFLALRNEPLRKEIGSAAASQEIEKPKEVTAYEECASRVFEKSKNVSDVAAECAAEMAALLNLHDEQVREMVRQRALADTQRTLRLQQRGN